MAESINVCRLCLKTCTVVIDIFDADVSCGMLVWKILQELLQFDVSKEDGLPATICRECLGKIKEFKSFQAMCISSKNQFLSGTVKREFMGPPSLENWPLPTLSDDQEEPVGNFPVKDENGDESDEDGNNTDGRDFDSSPTGASYSENEMEFVDEMKDFVSEIEKDSTMESQNGSQLPEDTDYEEDDFTLHLDDTDSEEDLSSKTDFSGNNTMMTLKQKSDDISQTKTKYHHPNGSKLSGDVSSGLQNDKNGSNDVRISSQLAADIRSNERLLLHPDHASRRNECKGLHPGLGQGRKQKINLLPQDDENSNNKPVRRVLRRRTRQMRKSSDNEFAVNVNGLREGAISNVDQILSSEMKTGENVSVFLCDNCGLSFVDKHKLTDHLLSHLEVEQSKSTEHSIHNSNANIESSNISGWNGSKGYCCNVCMKSYSSKIVLRNHIRTHSSGGLNSCKKSGKKLNSNYGPKKHLKGHSGGKPYKCRVCGKGFRWNSVCILHLRTHTGDKRFKCKHCGKAFCRISACISHERIHTNEKPFKCKHCGKTFVDNSRCSMHERIHTGDKRYKCKYCDKAFVQGTDRKKHELTHSNYKPFKCPHCEKAFYTMSNLSRHLVIHSSERPFKCEICSKDFKLKNTLVMHIRMHVGHEPYKCTVCGKQSGTMTNHNQHLRIHTGERPFKCDTCGRAFTARSNYKAHVKSHLKKRP